MPRTLMCCAPVLVLAIASFLPAEQTVTPPEMLIRLTVDAKAAPKPALRYLLLPELKEMQPGNPIPAFLKVALAEESLDKADVGRTALREADRAARLDKPDWQILLKAKTDGINLLLPDLQKMRVLAAALHERFREEVGQGRFDDAIRTAKTMFALARCMGEHPTLIGGLVGIAITGIGIGPLEEMLEQPGCPNLYWALTDLPSPLISLDKGYEGERLLIHAELQKAGLEDAAPMTAAQIKKVVDYTDKILAFDGKKDKLTRAYLDARNKNPDALRAARGRLVEVGYAEDLVKRFPPDQVLLLDAKRAFEVARDDMMKYMKLPTWQVERFADALNPPKDLLFSGFLPAMTKVRLAQGRIEQRIALLRHVEALRMSAAANGGKWPAKLADCPVPLPKDPFTNKPFRYEVNGEVAHLRGSPPAGAKANPAFNIHYQITLRK